MNQAAILVVSDPSGQFTELLQILREIGHEPRLVDDPAVLAEKIAREKPGALLLLAAGCPTWAALLAELHRLHPLLPLIVIGKLTAREAVSALRAGAFDYVDEADIADQLSVVLGSALAGKCAPGDEQSVVSGTVAGFANIVGASSKIKAVFSLIRKVCDTDTTVLVQGESGTGKELIARALHDQGERRGNPFVPVNCGAIPGELLESELFGHEKGAFTHAIRTRLGRFEMAHGGTVFLDEIAEMSPMLQVKLLRVLQERQFERIGGTKTITSDFRVVAATNRDLEEQVKNGNFREDLYYRLNVIRIQAPPLRERRNDIPLLADFFLQRFNRLKKKAIQGMTPEALAAMRNYGWPGNVRELENVLERTVILAGGAWITLEDLPERLRGAPVAPSGEIEEIPGEGVSLSGLVTDFEKGIIIQAMKQTGWVKNRAAKLLQVNRTTLLEKMKRYNIVNPSDS